MSFRDEARDRLAAAKNEMASGDDARLKYAALDLRMAMEAITYDRALAFKDEFPPDEYGTWQPRKVMQVLLEIDSSADADRALAIGRELESGVAAPRAHSLGTERVLNMAALRDRYDALGSYLHLVTMKQHLKGRSHDTKRLRARCEELAGVIEEVLASPIFNVTLGVFATMNCFRCERLIRKRIEAGVAAVAECFDCRATYDLIPAPEDQILWRPIGESVSCAAAECGRGTFLWKSDIQVGKDWNCGGCGSRNERALRRE